MSSSGTLLQSASAVLASRAETPTRKPPVTSFNSAQRPVASSASSQRSSRAGALRPGERDRLCQVSDEIIGPGEELGIDTAHGERADLRRLHFGEGELSRERGERPAALGIGRGREILGHQPQLAETRRREQQRIEQRGEAVHSASSSKPRSDRARALRPWSVAWRTTASSLPCVTQTSGAATSSKVASSSSQSAWSEMTSGSSTPLALARCLTRIQPDAIDTTGSGRRRDQRSATAP